MTESEAIEELKHSIVSYEVQNRNNITCDLTREVLNMAINALEKQIPKKPIRIGKDTCPKCGTYNETWVKRRNTLPNDIVYCWHCGQPVEITRE